MNVFKDRWLDYARRFCPAKPGTTQYVETERAFYAGATCVMGVCLAAGEPDVSEEDGAQLLHTIDVELTRYLQSVIELAKKQRAEIDRQRHENN
jgi:hypothetical protein